ncbi:hypothetical protein EW026_g1859 [Hermanssonia centrifuga]|uniref:Uncharacterized protein n=1 Tax=Hermanssonia centrifuga TaxID=98765 RepID=A0A4S4KUN2_9APHY|nr:hypothetical protein EW026_g1859 [Hermanssonia centrifuga]
MPMVSLRSHTWFFRKGERPEMRMKGSGIGSQRPVVYATTHDLGGEGGKSTSKNSVEEEAFIDEAPVNTVDSALLAVCVHHLLIQVNHIPPYLRTKNKFIYQLLNVSASCHCGSHPRKRLTNIKSFGKYLRRTLDQPVSLNLPEK